MIGKFLFPLLMLALFAKVSALSFQQNSTATCSTTQCKDFSTTGCDARFRAKHWAMQNPDHDQRAAAARKQSCDRNKNDNLDHSATNTVLFPGGNNNIPWGEIYPDQVRCTTDQVDDIWVCKNVPLNPRDTDDCSTAKCTSCETKFPTELWYDVEIKKENAHFYYKEVTRYTEDGAEKFDTTKCNDFN